MIKSIKCINIFLSSLLIFIFLFVSPVYADATYPTPTSLKYLNDYTGSISKDEIQDIVSIGKELEDKTGAQAVTVIIDSTNGIPIENYAIKLFRTWGIGQSKKDNGLLILLAINDKSWRVEVGRGLEGVIPDALSNRVMESVAKPNFVEGNYGKGLLDSYSIFSDTIAKEYGVTLEKSAKISLPPVSTNTKSSYGGGIILGVLAVSFILDLLFNRGRISSTLINLLFWSSFFRGGPRGGGGGFGGSGGGFGGFGGGSSNGGGSSGGW